MSFAPTDEQLAALDAFRTGQPLILEAGAGSGKTSTLKLLAADAPNRRGVYFAFNRSIADDAARTFPNSVLCKTLHSLAYRAVVTPTMKHRINGPRQNGRVVAKVLGLNNPERINDQVMLAPHQIASIATETVSRYCNGGTDDLRDFHVPTRNGMDDPESKRRLAQIVLPWARKAWADISADQGQLRVSHDHYLKTFALRRPYLGAHYVLLDEGQDSNGVTLSITQTQIDKGAQVVVVGDPNQAIYGWRGATDSMDAFGGTRLRLSKSFRFGSAIAEQANLWLDALGSDMRLTGHDPIDSQIRSLDLPDAVLARTNAEAVARVMEYQAAGVPVALVGGGDTMARLAEAAEQLKSTGQTWHPDLMAFQSWGQVQDFVEQEAAGSDLKTFVKLIDSYGTQSVINAMRRLADESRAQVIVSTAHKAKGREWHAVKIAGDFAEPKPNAETGETTLAKEEGMLAYVAVTRAQYALDRGSLDYIDRFLAERGGPVRVPLAAVEQAPQGREAVRSLLNAKKVCGAEHAAYLGVACKLAPHSVDVLHDGGAGLSLYGENLVRRPISA